MDYLLEVTFSVDDAHASEAVEIVTFLSDSTGSHLVQSGRQALARLFFESRDARAQAVRMIRESSGLVLREVDQPSTDWLDHYQQSLEPIVIGDRFVVAPDPVILPSDSRRFRLVIPQERAFGTGSHETTALCIEHFEQVKIDRRICLDAGTGSGILAIAMACLGARLVVALDNDPETADVIPANLARNGIEPGRVQPFIGTIRGGTRFDVIAMNILPEIILPLLPRMRDLLAAEGRVILSGVLREQAAEVRAAAEVAGLGFDAALERGEWWAGRFFGLMR